MGVDGAPAGWVAACLFADAAEPHRATIWQTRLALFADVAELAAFRARAGGSAAVAIDVPIGLPDCVGFRACDRAARELLKPRRASTVFAPPARYLLGAAGDYPAIRRLVQERRLSFPTAKGLSAQAAGIVPKVAEVDRFVREHLQAEAWLWECHPELSFRALDGGIPLGAHKRSIAGQRARRQLVRARFGDVEEQLARAPWGRRAVAVADMLDAYAALSTAVRCARAEHEKLGDGGRDAAGIPMRMAV
jgi:predicted RNase H-like nuclease